MRRASGLDSDKLDKLANDIRDSANRQDPVETQLETSQRIIARVTDGIYREPWAAFRELIVNAYDADASYVVVETTAPIFDHITVRDDGIGMSPRTLAYVLQNIGGSSKRTYAGAELNTVRAEANDRSPGGRLLIGKIGIGLFSVAQLTQHFQIITKSRGETLKTSATVRLKTHNEDNFQDDYIAGSVTIKSESVPEKERDTQGTSVVLYSLRPEVRRTLQSTRRWNAVLVETAEGESIQATPAYHIGFMDATDSSGDTNRNPVLPWKPSNTPEDKFEKLIDAVSEISGSGPKSTSLEHFDEYLRLVWKLSLSLPMDYISNHPFDLTGASGLTLFKVPKEAQQANKIELAKDETLRSRLQLEAGVETTVNPFSVTLDGVALRRPVRLPLQLVKPSRLPAPAMIVDRQHNPFSENNLERAGGPLSFEGYLYWNSKIVPKDTAGVLIRIREASGTLFDPTFLNYQVSEQTRLRQITAEIFVHEGLDSAVNIDRESFNYSHPHFLYIQRWLHRALRVLVNRLKALSVADLLREKALRHEQAQTAILTRAEGVWRRRYGEEADPPVRKLVRGTVPEDVAGVELKWSGVDISDDTDRITGLSIVLEAYGALSNLSVQDRTPLIKDIIDLLKDDS